MKCTEQRWGTWYLYLYLSTFFMYLYLYLYYAVLDPSLVLRVDNHVFSTTIVLFLFASLQLCLQELLCNHWTRKYPRKASLHLWKKSWNFDEWEPWTDVIFSCSFAYDSLFLSLAQRIRGTIIQCALYKFTTYFLTYFCLLNCCCEYSADR